MQTHKNCVWTHETRLVFVLSPAFGRMQDNVGLSYCTYLLLSAGRTKNLTLLFTKVLENSLVYSLEWLVHNLLPSLVEQQMHRFLP